MGIFLFEGEFGLSDTTIFGVIDKIFNVFKAFRGESLLEMLLTTIFDHSFEFYIIGKPLAISVPIPKNALYAFLCDFSLCWGIRVISGFLAGCGGFCCFLLSVVSIIRMVK